MRENESLMKTRIVPTHLPTYDSYYAEMPDGYPMCYVYHIHRDRLLNHLIETVNGSL